MSQIFLSHSSQNDFAAIAISEWLKKEGWDDQFLDIHPKQGIAAGERWERALYQAANRCDVVLFLISKAWLASDWCLKEFRLAYRLNKRIFGLLIEDIKVSDLSDEITNVWQMVNLGSGTDHQIFEVVHPDTGDQGHVTFSKNGLVRLRTGLNKAGIAPNFFDWPLNNDLDRAPYRGMRPIDEDDTGIFFGRDAPVIELLARLRGLRETPLPRFLVILGASGAGKSSFLRAGILPRLKRDDHCFLPLPIVRPEQSAMWGDNGFLNALGRAFSNRQMNDITPGELREVLEKKNIDKLSEILRQLADKATISAPNKKKDADIPTIVLSIDQGEELFQSKGANESEMLLDLIRSLLIEHSDLPLMILITIRSDSYDQLQTAKLLEGIPQQSYGLPPMPKGSYKEIIEKPAGRRLKNDKPLIVDPRLTDKLLIDIEEGGGKDVLPLLAFTLERLYLEYGSKGSLSLEDYNKMGGIKGAIDAAVEKAFQDAEKDPRLPNDREQLKHLLRRGFIPWLTGIDLETQKPRRRVARRNEIPTEAWPMIEHLIANRLLSTDIMEAGNIPIEPNKESDKADEMRIGPQVLAFYRNLLNLRLLFKNQKKLKLSPVFKWLDISELNMPKPIDLCDEMLVDIIKANKITVEPVHDALLRQWGLIVGWLEEDFAVLAVLEGVQRASRDWEANTRGSEYLVHSIRRLEEAERIESHKDMTKIFTSSDKDYLSACKGQRQDETRRLRHRATIYGVLAIVAVIAGLVAGWQWMVADRSKIQEIVAKNLATENQIQAQNEARKAKMTLSQSDFLQGIEKIEKNSTSAGLAYLASAIRNHPDRQHTSASARIVNLFIQRSFLLPLTAPLKHNDSVNSTVFSSDGTKIVTASDDKTARVWDAVTGKPLTDPLKHEENVNKATFSSDGTKIVTTTWRTVRIWDAATGAPQIEPLKHEDGVNSAVFSPDGTKLLTASGDFLLTPGMAQIWDVSTGKPLIEPLKHEDCVNSARFSPDGTKIVTATGNALTSGNALVWDVATGKIITGPMKHNNAVKYALFNQDCSKIATASYDTTVIVWDVTTGKSLTEPLRHAEKVYSAEFSPDGTKIITAAYDKTARVWDTVTGNPLTEPLKHERFIKSAIFSTDGSKIITVSQDLFFPHASVPRERDVISGRPNARVLKHDDIVRTAEFSPNGIKILTTSMGLYSSSPGTAQVWDAVTGKPLTEPLKHKEGVNSAVFSPDGTKIVIASDDKAARVWDAVTGKPLTEPLKHEKGVNSAVFSPDGTKIVTASIDKTAQVWDAVTGKPLTEPLKHEENVNKATFSPDGTKIVTATGKSSTPGISLIWDVATGKPLTEPLKHEKGVNSAVFSPDGTKIVTASIDKTAQVWDVVTGKPLTELLKHEESVYSAVFSPDGTKIVTASMDKSAMVWDTATGKPLTEPLKHKGINNSAVFSPDGARIVTTSWDKTARMWSIAPASTVSVPEWLAPLTEVVAGYRINDQRVLEPVDLSLILQFRERFRNSKDKDPYSQIARWFFADPATRPTSPYDMDAKERGDK